MAKQPKQSESVRLDLDVVEDARIAAAFERKPVGSMMSDILRPILKARIDAEIAKRSGKPKK